MRSTIIKLSARSLGEASISFAVARSTKCVLPSGFSCRFLTVPLIGRNWQVTSSSLLGRVHDRNRSGDDDSTVIGPRRMNAPKGAGLTLRRRRYRAQGAIGVEIPILV